MSISNRYFVREKDLVTRSIAGETIIVPVRNNVGDLDSIYTLNEVGSAIWELIDGKNSIVQIVEVVCDAYDVTSEVAKEDIIDFLNTLDTSGLIHLSSER